MVIRNIIQWNSFLLSVNARKSSFSHICTMFNQPVINNKLIHFLCGLAPKQTENHKPWLLTHGYSQHPWHKQLAPLSLASGTIWYPCVSATGVGNGESVSWAKRHFLRQCEREGGREREGEVIHTLKCCDCARLVNSLKWILHNTHRWGHYSSIN